MYEKFGQFMEGKWSPSENKETYEVINPATEEVLGHASKASPADVDRALKSAEKGFRGLEKNYTVEQILYFKKNSRPDEGKKGCISQVDDFREWKTFSRRYWRDKWSS